MGISINYFNNVDQFALTLAMVQQIKSTQVSFSIFIFLPNLRRYLPWLDDIQNVRMTG